MPTPSPFSTKTPDRAPSLAVACRIGPTRLIDNVVLGEDPPPLEPGPSADGPS